VRKTTIKSATIAVKSTLISTNASAREAVMMLALVGRKKAKKRGANGGKFHVSQWRNRKAQKWRFNVHL
jgi:hypothetical protein